MKNLSCNFKTGDNLQIFFFFLELTEKRKKFSRKNKDFFVKPDEHDRRCLWKCAPCFVTNDDSENSESEDGISSEEDQPDQKHEMILRQRSVSSSSSGKTATKSYDSFIFRTWNFLVN